jgi:Putative DNA-binding domain
MKPEWEWTETDIDALIKEQRQEDLSLDYKRTEALDKKNKGEIAKDVSAMANSAGGVLIYGIDEKKKTNGPIEFDGGVDPQKISTEWLEQVIDSNIDQRIEGVRVHKIAMPLKQTPNVIYLVWIPQSNRGPHMADHRYHKRLGTTTAFMEEYEVRDVARRSESPDIDLNLDIRETDDRSTLVLIPSVTNTSPEPAFYATFRLYFGARNIQLKSASEWSRQPDIELLWEESDLRRFTVYHLFWGVPERKPLLEGEQRPSPCSRWLVVLSSFEH